MWDAATREFKRQKWRELRVGQLVKVLQEENVPADIVLLKSADSKGVCYMETKNLDGETNLKHKVVERALN